MRKYTDFNRKWAFTKEAESVPDKMPEKWNYVNLPHTWNDIDGQDGGNDYYRGKGYYAKQFDLDILPDNHKHFLEIKGANSMAEVYLNGALLGAHEGGYSTFRLELTGLKEKDNLLVVIVSNADNDHVYPRKADFTFYGGLYREVSVISVPRTHFELVRLGTPGIRVTPVIEGNNANVEVNVEIDNPDSDYKLEIYLEDDTGNKISGYQGTTLDTGARFLIKNVHLWHGKKDPYLYKAVAKILYQGEECDRVSTHFGCRSFVIDSHKGFILNGEPYPLRGVSRHQDRYGIGNALSRLHHKEDMEMILELGANTVRLAHYQHDSYFYDLCDIYGLIVWAEIPYISEHLPNGRGNTKQALEELICQNYNHPSIVVWGLSNEITMAGNPGNDLVENHIMLNDLAHKMDPHRLTTVAAVTMCDPKELYLKVPDVLAYNHYFGWYGGDVSMNGPWFDKFHREYPNVPIGVSEYGCEALNWHTSNPTQGDYTEEYQAYYHEELIKQLFSREYLWCTYVWNMFDFGADARCEGGENGQNHKGLVTFDRKYRKDAFYAYKAWLSTDPFVHICGKRYVDRMESVTRITVYSNLPEVELVVNGKSFETKKSEGHFFYFDVPNEGETQLMAIAGSHTDISFFRKVNKFNEDYRLKEQGAVLNWFDVQQKEGYFSLNDKIDDILQNQESRSLLETFFLTVTKRSGERSMMGEALSNSNMLDMMGNFTVIRLSGLMGAAGVNVSKEELLSLNEKLNRVAK